MATQFHLVMRSGPTPGTTYPLEAGQIIIGRDSANAVSINDAEVSRKHARLTFQGGKYVLEDLGSTNGTSVNGQRISGPHVLRSGDTIALSEQISLVFESVTFDADATVASARPAVAARPVAAPPPPPAQAYAGQVPPGPAPAQPAKRANLSPIIIAVVVLLVICACGGFFWWVDATYRWCVFFSFIPGC